MVISSSVDELSEEDDVDEEDVVVVFWMARSGFLIVGDGVIKAVVVVMMPEVADSISRSELNDFIVWSG